MRDQLHDLPSHLQPPMRSANAAPLWVWTLPVLTLLAGGAMAVGVSEFIAAERRNVQEINRALECRECRDISKQNEERWMREYIAATRRIDPVTGKQQFRSYLIRTEEDRVMAAKLTGVFGGDAIVPAEYLTQDFIPIKD